MFCAMRLWLSVSALRTVRHVGHDAFCSIHVPMHERQNVWPSRQLRGSNNTFVHTEHSNSSATPPTNSSGSMSPRSLAS